MKFKAHQSFFIRKGWLSKGIRAVENNSSIFMPSNSREAMDGLGLGSNQVVALRYWLTSLGLMEKDASRKEHKLTDLCNLILEYDPYIEELGTLWILHYNLAMNQEDATSWYWFFNRLNAKVFNKRDLVDGLHNYVLTYNASQNSDSNSSKAVSSLESDADCILSTYIPHERLTGKRVSPESVIDCPLGDLGILDVENRSLKTYRKKTASSDIPPLVILYGVLKQIDGALGGNEGGIRSSTEIKIADLLTAEGSPGKVFNVDSVLLLNKLYELERLGYLSVNKTAGSDVVRLVKPDLRPLDCLAEYYKVLG